MDKESISKERNKVFKKLVEAGYNTDKKILEIKIEDLIISSNFNRRELSITISMKQAISNKRLVSFLCGTDVEEGK